MIVSYHRPSLRAPVEVLRDGSPHGAVVAAIEPLLDGARSLEEVVGHLLGAGFEVEAILAALDWLDEHDLVEEAPGSDVARLTPEERARYEGQMRALAAFGRVLDAGLSPLPAAGLAAQAALKRSSAVVAGAGRTAAALGAALAPAGVGTVVRVGGAADATSGDGGDGDGAVVEVQSEADAERLARESAGIFVYCPDEHDEEFASWLNGACLSATVPLLLSRRGLFEVLVGPLVVPGETACYECYVRRRRGASATTLETNASAPPEFTFPLGVEFLTLEIVRVLTGVAEPVTRGRLWRWDLRSGEADVHPVLKLPRCPACGVHRRRPVRKLWEE